MPLPALKTGEPRNQGMQVVSRCKERLPIASQGLYAINNLNKLRSRSLPPVLPLNLWEYPDKSQGQPAS